MLAKSPRNKQLLRTTANLLLKTSVRKRILKARQYRRRLESFEKPGTTEWLTARYHVALCTFQLAEYAECRKLLKVTKLLYPRLGGGELRRKFETLRQNVSRKLAAGAK